MWLKILMGCGVLSVLVGIYCIAMLPALPSTFIETLQVPRQNFEKAEAYITRTRVDVRAAPFANWICGRVLFD